MAKCEQTFRWASGKVQKQVSKVSQSSSPCHKLWEHDELLLLGDDTDLTNKCFLLDVQGILFEKKHVYKGIVETLAVAMVSVTIDKKAVQKMVVLQIHAKWCSRSSSSHRLSPPRLPQHPPTPPCKHLYTFGLILAPLHPFHISDDVYAPSYCSLLLKGLFSSHAKKLS